MRSFATIEKEEGETPLMALERLRAREHLGDVPLTYAGRLDPMATGTLLILIGDECKKRAVYDSLDKEYVFEVLFDCSSDTGDILGLAEVRGPQGAVTQADVRRVLSTLVGEITLPYPAYSSKTVDGVPLFEHARKGTLHAIVQPSAATRIHKLTLEDLFEKNSGELVTDIERRLALLHIDEKSTNPYKDFRRDAVREQWRKMLQGERTYTVARIRAVVSSGTYMRTLAPRVAAALGTCGLAYSIDRTRIGRYVALPFGWGFWARSY